MFSKIFSGEHESSSGDLAEMLAEKVFCKDQRPCRMEVCTIGGIVLF